MNYPSCSTPSPKASNIPPFELLPGQPNQFSETFTSISAKHWPAKTCPPSSTTYWISFPAEGERRMEGSFSFSNTQVLFPMVMRYLGKNGADQCNRIPWGRQGKGKNQALSPCSTSKQNYRKAPQPTESWRSKPRKLPKFCVLLSRSITFPRR